MICSVKQGISGVAVTLRSPNLPEEDESILEENGNTRIHDFPLWKVTDLKIRKHV